MTEDTNQLKGFRTSRAWPLYAAAFSTAVSLNICWTSMPFVLSGIGATEAHVGYALAFNSLAYMVALILTGSLLGHLDVRKATRLATVVALVAAVAMVLAVLGGIRSTEAGRLLWIWTIIAAGVFGGAAMALYWPFLMSWVSARFEGYDLNRRFGRYNGAWSGGALVGPVAGGWLVAMSPLWPMGISVFCFVVTLVLLTVTRSASPHVVAENSSDKPVENGQDMRVLTNFRWMSRISLFCSWATQAIARSQFALLFVAMGYTEEQFGLYYGVFALCNFLALVGAGRWAYWHFKPASIFMAQAMLLIAAVMMLVGRTLPIFFVSAIILGVGFGFSYGSHLFYGAAGSRNRSARMALHETVISLGITVGAGAGGYLAKNLGAYAPYWFAIVLIVLGGLAQLAIHLASQTLVVRSRS